MRSKIISILGKSWGQRLLLFIILIIVMAIFQPLFFSWNNLLSILLAVSIYGVMACGMLVAIIMGALDLSIGSMAALSCCIALSIAANNHYTLPACIIGILLALCSAVIVGIIHGFFDATLHLPGFIVTLASQSILYALADMVIHSKYVHLTETDNLYYYLGNTKLFGIPTPIVIFLLIALITYVFLTKTKVGRLMYAAGGNPSAAELIGVNVKLYKTLGYMVCSLTAAIAGIVLSSMNMLAAYTTAKGYEGRVMMAVVVGGVSITGGEGSVAGTLFGVLLVGIINNAMILLGINTDYTEFVQGVVIIAAVALNVYGTKKKSSDAAKAIKTAA